MSRRKPKRRSQRRLPKAATPFLDQDGMRGVEARVLLLLRKEWLTRIEAWLKDADDDWQLRRLTDQANRLRRQLGIRRPTDPDSVRARTRERVARFRARRKRQAMQQAQQVEARP